MRFALHVKKCLKMHLLIHNIKSSIRLNTFMRHMLIKIKGFEKTQATIILQLERVFLRKKHSCSFVFHNQPMYIPIF